MAANIAITKYTLFREIMSFLFVYATTVIISVFLFVFSCVVDTQCAWTVWFARYVCVYNVLSTTLKLQH